DDRDVSRHARPKLGDHVAVDLDRGQMGNRRRQSERQRPGTRTNFEKAISRRWVDRAEHLVGPDGFEEMLSEPFSPQHYLFGLPAALSGPFRRAGATTKAA